jgi:DNA-binding NtrC family response regulator
MVYGFAKQSGGTIRMESEPGRGTEVRLYFPASVHAAVAAIPLVGSAAVVDRTRADPHVILAVDDDLEVLNIADMFLTRCGYRVMRATGMEDALRWITGPEPISLLFTDVVLGGGETGPKLVAEAHKIRAKLPVLYTSGFAHGSLGVADVRPVEFLAKPYHQDELIARVEALLKGAQPSLAD